MFIIIRALSCYEIETVMQIGKNVMIDRGYVPLGCSVTTSVINCAARFHFDISSDLL
jgi:hypothetical protein